MVGFSALGSARRSAKRRNRNRNRSKYQSTITPTEYKPKMSPAKGFVIITIVFGIIIFGIAKVFGAV